MEVEVVADTHEFHRRLHHSFRGIPVGEQHPFRQGAVIDPDPESFVLIPQQRDERFERFTDPRTDGGELLF